MRTLLFIFLTSCIVISMVSVSLSQTDSLNHANTYNIKKECAVKLQQKILLSQEQTTRLESILKDFFDAPSTNNQKIAEKKLESILDSRQKIKYEIIRKDWWNTIYNSVKK